MDNPPKKETAATTWETIVILDLCAVIETRCGEIYRKFAEITADIPELETLWKKTAHEEDHHALQFKMLSRLRQGTTVNVDAETVSTVVKKLEALLDQIGTAPLTAAETLRLGIKLEEYLCQYHSSTVVTCTDPEMTKLLQAMMNNDREHVEMLERAYKKFQQKGKE